MSPDNANLRIVTFGLVMLCAMTLVCAQSDRGTVSALFTSAELSVTGELQLDLGGRVLERSDVADIKLHFESVPEGTPLLLDGITISVSETDPDSLIIHFDPAALAKLPAGPMRVLAKIPTSNPAQSLDKDTDREMRALNARFADSLERFVASRMAYSKASREKHFYLSGGVKGGEMAVNHVFYKGNTWQTSSLINQIDFLFDFDKGAGSKADPDFFNLGISFRKILPLHRGTIKREVEPLMRAAQFSAERSRAVNAQSESERQLTREAMAKGLHLALAEVNARTAEENKAFLRALVITPFAPRLETNLNGHGAGYLVNFVNKSEVQLRSGVKLLVGDENQATINRENAKQPMGNVTFAMNVMPLAFEAGVAIRNPDDPGRRGNPIFRLNTGAIAKFTYNFPCRVDVFFSRAELEISGVNRHLFNEETSLNQLTNRTDGLVKGNKYAFKTDFRFIFGFVTPIWHFRRRPAITVTYKNGFFPPLYVFNNSVSVHFTLESEDDTSFDDIKASPKEVQFLRAAAALH